MSNDFQNSIMKLLDTILQCRPDDPYEFASIFFVDEQSPSHKLSHAIHSLPFHYRNPITFRNTSSLIFCLDIMENIGNGSGDPSGGMTTLMTSGGGTGYLDTELISSFNVQKIASHLYGLQRQTLSTLFHEVLSSPPALSSSPTSFHAPLSFTFPEFEYLLMSIVLSIKFYDILLQIIDQFLSSDYQLNYKSIDEFLSYFKLLRPSPLAELYDPSPRLDSSRGNTYEVAVVKGVEVFKQKFVSTSLWNRVYSGSCVQLFLLDRYHQMTNQVKQSSQQGKIFNTH
jgi:hypothetical protein